MFSSPLHLVFTAFLALFMTHCATTPKLNDSSSTVIDPKSSSDFKLEKPVTANISSGTADYKFKNQNYKSQWIKCVANKNAPFVTLFHSESNAIDATTFCSDWSAQVLFKNNYNVIAVNRAGFSGSNGTSDLSGPQSIAGILAGLNAGIGSDKIIGFWGIDAGVIAATFTAKAISSSFPKIAGNLQWLLVGQGFYDLEIIERNTKDENLKQTIQKLKTAEGDVALEKRSISWDSAGLPKLISIYHSKANDVAPKSQADAFNDQLRTAQTKVFFDEIDGVGHEIPWQSHYQIVDKALKNIQEAQKLK